MAPLPPEWENTEEALYSLISLTNTSISRHYNARLFCSPLIISLHTHTPESLTSLFLQNYWPISIIPVLPLLLFCPHLCLLCSLPLCSPEKRKEQVLQREWNGKAPEVACFRLYHSNLQLHMSSKGGGLSSSPTECVYGFLWATSDPIITLVLMPAVTQQPEIF